MVSALVPAKLVDTEGQLLEALREGSEVLQNITDGFAPLMKDFRVFFFWEQEKTDMGFTRDYVRSFFFSLVVSLCWGGGRGGFVQDVLMCYGMSRWLKNRPQRQYWTIPSELVYLTTIEICASLKAALRVGIDSW